jgi:hypothetical protein
MKRLKMLLMVVGATVMLAMATSSAIASPLISTGVYQAYFVVDHRPCPSWMPSNLCAVFNEEGPVNFGAQGPVDFGAQGPPPDCPSWMPSNVCVMPERPLAGPPPFA